MNDADLRDAALSVLHRYRQGNAGMAEDALAELGAVLLPEAVLMANPRRAAVDEWFAIYDAYHKASDVYNARVQFIREQEAAGRFGEFNAHGEYKLLNEAQRATYGAAEALYQALRAAV